jgi:hypothetical protein
MSSGRRLGLLLLAVLAPGPASAQPPPGRFLIQFLGAPASLPLPGRMAFNWTLVNRTAAKADGEYEFLVDGRARPAVQVSLGSRAGISGVFSIDALAAGSHTIVMRFRRFTGGSHLEPNGPNGVHRVPNSRLAVQAATTVSVTVPLPPDIACNRDPRLCDRRFDQVSYATTHNAFVNGVEASTSAEAQPNGLRAQLNAGIRALMLDSHEKNGVAYLCHETCASTDNTLASGLIQVRQFLVDNPHDVVTVFIENYTTADQLETAFNQAGLLSLVYTFGTGLPAPEPGRPQEPRWPTLREMIEMDRRLVVLVDSPEPEKKYPWLHYEYAYDGQMSYTYVDWLGNIATDCANDRGRPDAMIVMNHFLQSPYNAGYNEINTFDFMNRRAQRCRQERGHIINFIAVNHYDTSAVLSVVAAQNGP